MLPVKKNELSHCLTRFCKHKAKQCLKKKMFNHMTVYRLCCLLTLSFPSNFWFSICVCISLCLAWFNCICVFYIKLPQTHFEESTFVQEHSLIERQNHCHMTKFKFDVINDLPVSICVIPPYIVGYDSHVAFASLIEVHYHIVYFALQI